MSQASEKRESYHHMSGVRISSVDDAKAAADRRLVRGNRISNIWREGALCSEMGEKRGMCPLILPFQKWRETGDMAMTAAVRQIVRGKRISDHLAGRSSVFQSGREAGDAPSNLDKPRTAGNWRRGHGWDGLKYLCANSNGITFTFPWGSPSTSKKIKCSRIKINNIK